MRSPAGPLLSVALALGAAAVCKKATPSAPPRPLAEPPAIEVLTGGRWLFTHVEPDGRFATTDKPASIPEGARRVVRVMDPAPAASRSSGADMVHVIDAGELLASGKARGRPMSRAAFETAALAQLPEGEHSLLAARPAGVASEPAGAPGVVDGATGPAAGGAAVVTLYGTSWCGACREARRYLAARRIPFVDKDVERDAAAARELAEKAARLGVPADRVPVLDVRGRLLVGFDRARLEALLGQPM